MKFVGWVLRGGREFVGGIAVVDGQPEFNLAEGVEGSGLRVEG